MEPKTLEALEVNANKHDAKLTWSLFFENDEPVIFTCQKHKLAEIILKLLNLFCDEEVREHLAPADTPVAGSTVEYPVVPFEDVSAGFVETSGNFALSFQLRGPMNLLFHFPSEKARKLFALLRDYEAEFRDDKKKPRLN